MRQVDAFAAKDYRQAQDLANQTYPQVFGLARNMADAFGATVAARMPQGGAETGGGGTGGAPESSTTAVKEAGRARSGPAG